MSMSMSADPIDRYVSYAGLMGLVPETTLYGRRRSLIRVQAALPVPLAEATPAMLLEWRAALTVCDQAIRNYVTDVSQFCKWAMAAGLRGDNPAAGLPVPRRRRRLPRPIAEEDLFFGVTCAPPRIRLCLVLAGWCGMRAKEIACLRRECVLDTRRPPVILIAGDATKGGGERIVPLAPYPLAHLRAAGLPRSGWIIRRADGQPGPNRPHAISQACNRYLHGCGIGATLQQLRHWYGTTAGEITLDIRVVQELMGHQSPETTAGYMAYNQARAIDVVAALPVPGRLRRAA